MRYKTIIGLEIHVELLTNSKMFCSCTNEFGGDVNTHTCPVCLGLPGAMPVLNEKVLEYAIKAGLAFDCHINTDTRMDRKNYFYPDLVKGYQISQDDIPLCSGGYIELDLEDGAKTIRLDRIHIEEDTGKSIHTEEGETLLDYNRAGVPLIEIVSQPDLNTPEEARIFLEKLKSTLEYLRVSDCKMEEGSLRCDVNINMMDEETGERTNITELKNLNSFRAAVRAMEYEEKRHKKLLEEGKNTVKETRRWDEVEGETIVMREKGEASDFRYVVDGDFLPIKIDQEWVEEIKANLPELPHHKKARLIKDYKIPEYDAGVLTQSREIADFFEETVEFSKDAVQVSNWIMGDVLRRLNDAGLEIKDLKFGPKDLSDLLALVNDGKISNNIGKKVLRDMFESGKSPEKIVEEKGLIQISDAGELEGIVEEILAENQQSIEDYRAGRDRALGFLVGQVMKATRGKANPQMVNEMIRKKIEE